ncbi:hypothetical protein [Amycolatopsis taiwanensis]|uniref:hypothetical protein n=1 Tax=Amycolatopsis taiwanensis TaxID=342230 RepID=UPI000486AA10|nr:hypothetical protein [Amycolatopsis taiwanensis]
MADLDEATRIATRLTGAGIRRLRLDDLDRHHGRLTVPRPGRPHTVYIDEYTLNLATAWL